MALQTEKPSERRSGDKEASRQTILVNSVIGGLIAGAVLAIAMMIGFASTGVSAGAPWQFFASIILGVPALQALTLGVFLVGLAVHVVFSALFGLIWGLVATGVPKGIRDNMGTHAAAAGVYGLILWIVNFQFLARGFYPWFLETNQLLWALSHVVFYGIPLGLYLAARLGYVESVPMRRPAESRT